MMNITILRKLTVVLVALFFASCDKDYNTLGSDIVGNENFNFSTVTPDVKVYNQKIPAVQTNNLSINQLGIYDNPVFGKTKANFVTQLTLATVAPTFKSNIVIDSVIVTAPYFSTKGETDSSGKTDYTLNNIKEAGTINLQVFRNGKELLDFDPTSGFTSPQRYFSDQDSDFNTAKIGAVLNNDITRPNENTTFTFSDKEYVKYKIDSSYAIMPRIDANIESRNSPRMRLHLDKDYFRDEIINIAANSATSGNFVNNNAFKSYFKGLYFQVQDASSGTMAAIDFAKGDVTIYYKQDKIKNDTAPIPVREIRSLTLNMSGNTVNLLDNTDYNTNYTNGIIASSTPTGQLDLFLKGGQGCMAFVELFAGTQGADLLTTLKAKNVLVNDATLTFTVNNSLTGSAYTNPQRIYVYDADNHTPLYDYYFDNSTNSSDAKLNKPVHGGILETVNSKSTYKVRITEHVDRILKGTIKNVRLGVVVTEDINLVAHAFLYNSNTSAPSTFDLLKKMDRLPVSSVLNTSGTVLHGNNSHPDGVKFEIHYTKPN